MNYPTLRELLRDEMYRDYFMTPAKLPATLLREGATPWRVWVKTGVDSGVTWRKKDFPRYKAARDFVLEQVLPRERIVDAALSCKPKGFAAPMAFLDQEVQWELQGWRWCWRCRRPVTFGVYHRHHAVPGYSALASEALRCPICGIREIAM